MTNNDLSRTIEALMASNLSDKTNRLVLADAIEDRGVTTPEEEAAVWLLRNATIGRIGTDEPLPYDRMPRLAKKLVEVRNSLRRVFCSGAIYVETEFRDGETPLPLGIVRVYDGAATCFVELDVLYPIVQEIEAAYDELDENSPNELFDDFWDDVGDVEIGERDYHVAKHMKSEFVRAIESEDGEESVTVYRYATMFGDRWYADNGEEFWPAFSMAFESEEECAGSMSLWLARNQHAREKPLYAVVVQTTVDTWATHSTHASKSEAQNQADMVHGRVVRLDEMESKP